MKSIKKILIVKLSALGDIVHLSWILPALRAFHPDLQIDWVVRSQYRKFLELFDEIDNVIPLDLSMSANPITAIQKLSSIWKSVRHHHYDAVVDAQGLLRSALILKASKSRKRIGFAPPVAREGSHWFYDCKSIKATQEINVMDKYLTLFEEIGVSRYQAKRPTLGWSRLSSKKVETFLENFPGDIKVVLNPSASFYTKVYPLDQIVALAEKFRKEYAAPLIVLNDRTTLEGKEISQHPDIVLTPFFSLEELLFFFKRCDALIGVDSGPSYLAELVGIPSLILFGPTNLERQSPSRSRDPQLQSVFSSQAMVGEGGRIRAGRNLSMYSSYDCPIIRPGVIYSPYRCLKRNCSNNLCMQKFKSEEIIHQMKAILEPHVV